MDNKKILRFSAPRINDIQFHAEMEKMPDFIRLESGLYGDGLRWLMALDERDGAGHVSYYVPPGYRYRSEEERAKYESQDRHDMQEVYGELLLWARALAKRTTGEFLKPDWDHLRECGFEIEEAE